MSINSNPVQSIPIRVAVIPLSSAVLSLEFPPKQIYASSPKWGTFVPMTNSRSISTNQLHLTHYKK
jgi:hypothetical protein